jgi:hypothetical protein
MIRKLGYIFGGAVSLMLLSPMFVYWWGLLNLDADPVPSQIRLTSEQEQIIWTKEKETGVPHIKSITPYGYILSVICNVNKGFNASECMEKYPGLRLSTLAVRRQMGSQVTGKGNTVWQITWLAYTTWVTQHWDIHQILATYQNSKQDTQISIDKQRPYF